MARHNEIGKLGEEYAQAYLGLQGYKIRHTNWVSGKYEIDVVAEKEDCLVIVEIKTRSEGYLESPEEAVNIRKMRNLVYAAQAYIMQYDWQGETRFDIVSVICRNDDFEIEHIEDAFLPSLNW